MPHCLCMPLRAMATFSLLTGISLHPAASTLHSFPPPTRDPCRLSHDPNGTLLREHAAGGPPVGAEPFCSHILPPPPRRHLHARASDGLRCGGAHQLHDALKQVSAADEHRRKNAEEHHVVGGRPGDLEFCGKIDVHDVACAAPGDHVDVLVVAARDSVSSLPWGLAEPWKKKTSVSLRDDIMGETSLLA